MRRREFIHGMAASRTALRASHGSSPENRPNFLILMSDQHNSRVMGCRGDPVAHTPNLDALARRGVLFENAYCPAPQCVPSRMSFLTGQQPSSIRVWHNTHTLASDIPTFAHALGASGYETALIGRMHFEGPDQWHGFEKLLVGNLTPMCPHVPRALPRELMAGAGGNSRAGVTLAGPGKTAYQVHDEQVAEAASTYLAERARATDRPFCAVAGFVLPHPPYICPAPEWDRFSNRVEPPQVPPGYFQMLHPAMRLWRKNRGIEDLTSEEIRRARAAYYGLVAYMDELAGRVLRALAATGLDRDTIVIYLSDHGDMAGEHGMWWKNTFYEGSAAVPMIVSWPARFHPGRRVREVVSLIDIAPTLLDYARGESLPHCTGASLRPLLEGSDTEWKNEAFSESPPVMGVPAMRMIRGGQWKLSRYEGYRPQLFDLENDPHEFNDLGLSPVHAGIRGKLLSRAMDGWPAELLRAEFATRNGNRQLLRKWAEHVRPAAPQQWRPPAGSNVFPVP